MIISSRIRSILLLMAIACVALMVTGCGKAATETPANKTESQAPQGESQATSATEQATNSEGATLYTPAYAPNGKEVAIMTTSKGVITIELFGTDAPIHVGNFVELARKGFYNGTKFHRYEPGFVVQGGDPQTKDLSSEQVVEAVKTGSVPLGTGGPGYVIKGEFDQSVNPNKHLLGSLGMARSNNPDSAGSQFYFCLADLTPLDGSYTVFGRITDGLDVMKQLRIGDVIEKVEIKNATE